MLSIIIPTLNEAAVIYAALARLPPLRDIEIIVADGGSMDATRAVVLAQGVRVVAAPRGRASQMNAGAAIARGDVLLFLHADTTLPADADALIRDAIKGGAAWGRFDVTIDGRHPFLPVVAALMNGRSRLTSIATGDQAIFVTRRAFTTAGCYPDIPLMEDIALSKRLKRLGPPACLSARVITSGRRWETKGVARTILTMWVLRAAYALGADPARLARLYGYEPRES
jgi:rSAM/selenodomain-associated transferase 2